MEKILQRISIQSTDIFREIPEIPGVYILPVRKEEKGGCNEKKRGNRDSRCVLPKKGGKGVGRKRKKILR